MNPARTLLAPLAPLAGVILAGACSQAHAQFDFYRRVTPPTVAEGGVVGAAVIAGRQYQGSDESRVRLLPSIDYQWGNGFFAGTQNGLGYNASTLPFMAYGARITADFGRGENRSAALQGLGDIQPRPALGVFFNFSPARTVLLQSSLRYGSGNDREGLLMDFGASWGTALSPGLRLGANVATSWANANHLQSYFGVDTLQSARSGYALFTPGAGLKDVRLGASLAYRIAPAWSLVGSVSYAELLGDARQSPIVREKGTTAGVLALGYSF